MNLDERERMRNAFRYWTSGNQEAAVTEIRSTADQGELASLLVICWFLHQMGDRTREAIPYAKTAISQGAPQAANYVWGYVLNTPGFAADAVTIAQLCAIYPWPLEPIGNAPQLWAQGQEDEALNLIEAGANPKPPFTSEAGSEIARSLATSAVAATGYLHEIEDSIASLRVERAAVENETVGLRTMISGAMNAQANKFFDEQATTNQSESKTTWRIGVGILIVAAIIAVIPILGYYFESHDFIEKKSLVWAHFAPAAALGTVAGVFLARSRARDRVAQRARDLSVALNTTFAYSSQLQSPDEQARFRHDMGRTVIEAFLRQDGPRENEGRSLLDALRPQPT